MPGWLGPASGALCLAFFVAGCGNASNVQRSEDSHQTAYPAGLGDRRLSKVPIVRRLAKAPGPCKAAVKTLGSPNVAYAAVVEKDTVIRTQPRGGASVVGRIGRLDKRGFREVLGLMEVRSSSRCAPDWYRVRLSVLPNGATGWVRASAVAPYRVHSRIVVDLSQRRLRLFRSGKMALETSVAVGSPATPTPRGHYFVNQRYVLPDGSGPFGPHALGISAHSEALQHTWVENGPIAIHGTNEPQSIGQAASHGCIRVANDVIRRLFPLAPAGTPVIVKA